MVRVNRRTFVLFLLGAAAGTSLAAEPGPGPTPAGPAKWEYRILTREQVAKLGKNDVVAGLNRLGKDGWELVAVEPALAPAKGAGAVQFYLKRPRDDRRARREEAQDRVDAARAYLAMWQERSAWSERMVRKGLLTEAQAGADKARVAQAALALDRAERELRRFIPEKERAPGRK
jgi:hypothetical protein